MTATYEQRLAELTSRRAERLDLDDLPGNLTQRERNAYVEQTLTLDRQVSAIRTAAEAVSFPTLDADAQFLAFLRSANKVIGEERMTIKSPIKDREIKRRADDLEWSLDFIHRGFNRKPNSLPIVTLAPTAIGKLMMAAGY